MTPSLRRQLASHLPETLYSRILIERSRSDWQRTGAIFIHIPKAAGISISKALYGHPRGHYYATDVRRFAPQEFSSLYTFAVVRNPVQRLQSAYRFARYGSTGEATMSRQSFFRSNPHFDSFEVFVESWLASQDLERIDGVFRPQHLYVCGDGRTIVDDIIHLENLANELPAVESRIGRKLDVPHLNRSLQSYGREPSRRSLEVIHHLYAKDFAAFGYSH